MAYRRRADPNTHTPTGPSHSARPRAARCPSPTPGALPTPPGGASADWTPQSADRVTPGPVDSGVLERIGFVLAEALFPAKCIGCQRRGTVLCDECRKGLPYLPSGVCRRCASLRGPRGVCRGCRRLSPALSGVRAAFAYDGAARAAVLTLKFKSGRYLAPMMGEFLRAELRRRPLQADIVVPVPLASTRTRARGFNQAPLLAKEVAVAVKGTV